MTYEFFSLNGRILPTEQATVSLDDVAYLYGYGVYESIRYSNGKIYFIDEHSDRLMKSAQIIGLEHEFSPAFVKKSLKELVSKNMAETCNLKVLLVGGRAKADANLYIMCLQPLFPDRKLYKNGTACITYTYERDFPGAKTLNMLPSYLAFKQAKLAGAYDALLVDRQGCITEGTRTNFFAMLGKTIYTPREETILQGVTRHHVLEVATTKGYKVVEQEIKLNDVSQYDSCFLTSTSAKIMPINTINNTKVKQVSQELKDLMSAFDQFLASY